MHQRNPFDETRESTARRRLDRAVRFRVTVIAGVFAGGFVLAFLGGIL